MAVSSTSGVSGAVAADTTSSSTSSSTEQTLNQADFLKLLVAQLASQDPLNPISNTDFIGTMAQFSSLEEATTMQQNMSGIQANALLGQTVEVEADDGTKTTGVVSAVTFKSGVPTLTVNGASYDLSQVLSTSETSTSK